MSVIRFFENIANMFQFCGEIFVEWAVNTVPSIFMILILCNAMITFVSKEKIEKIAQAASKNLILKYMLLPFLGAILLGNPVALTLGKFVDEKSKPSYYASASFFCHTSNGVFPHINATELFIWLGIAKGVQSVGYSTIPLAMGYLLTGLVLNFMCGVVTDATTSYFCKKQGIHLKSHVRLRESDTEKKKRKKALSREPEKQDAQESIGIEKASEKWDVLKYGRYGRVEISVGRGGFGNTLEITPTEEKHKIAYITAGGRKPEVVEKLETLTGCEAVNGFEHRIEDEELCAVVIDCAGSLRCGIYPKKRIPTINIMPTGKSGPLAKYITEDIYVSAVSCQEIRSLDEEILRNQEIRNQKELGADETAQEENGTLENVRKIEWKNMDLIGGAGRKTGVFIQTFYKSAQDGLETIVKTILPLMGFVSLLMGIIEYTGVGTMLSNQLKFLGEGSFVGLLILGFISSIPLLSPLLAPGAIIAQIIGAFIGTQIASGAMPVTLALPALYAINTQGACDFIPVGLGLAEAEEETMKIGVPSVLFSRFLCSVPRVCGAAVVGYLMGGFF